MKIAFVTDDERTVSAHFGRALHYVVLTVEGGQVTLRETREKAAHHHAGEGAHEQGAEHHHGAAADDLHAKMASPIGDCQTLIAGGMGRRAYTSLQQRGIAVMITDVEEIDAATQAFIAGTLQNHLEYLH